MNVEVNYLAVLVAAVVSMIVGFLWYSPQVLGKPWARERGLSQDDIKKAQKEMGVLYAVSFVVALVTSYVLFHVMVMAQNFFHYSPLATGITSGFWMWLGFIMPVQVTATIFAGKNWKLLGIDTGYQFLSILAMGVVLGSMM